MNNTLGLRLLEDLFEAKTGQRFPAKKNWRIDNSLTQVIKSHGLQSIDELATLLKRKRTPALEQQIVDSILNNESYFFRDRAMFDTLIDTAIPEIERRNGAKKHISIWSTACSTGQEAYSLAILFAEQPARWDGWTVSILGTDVSTKAVTAAREARFTPFQIQRGLGATQMLRWFDEVGGDWVANNELRQMVRFEVHNVFDPPPGRGQFDLVLCRNMLIYFPGEKRTQIFARLASAMAPGAWLMLGAGETILGHTDRLIPDAEVPSLFRTPHDSTARATG